MEHLARVVLVVKIGLVLALGLEFSLDFSNPLDAVLHTSEPLIYAFVYREVLVPTLTNYFVNFVTRNVVHRGWIADVLFVFVIGLVDLLFLIRGQARVSMYHHRGLLLRFSLRLITPIL